MVGARIDELRDLIARIEESPASAERDALLRLVRDRVVTVETGIGRSSAWRSLSDDRHVEAEHMVSVAGWFR
jgi:hypothetical protein